MSTTVLEEKMGQATPRSAVELLRGSFESGQTRPLPYRQKQLDGLARFLKEREYDIEAALHDDMGRPAFEVYPRRLR